MVARSDISGSGCRPIRIKAACIQGLRLDLRRYIFVPHKTPTHVANRSLDILSISYSMNSQIPSKHQPRRIQNFKSGNQLSENIVYRSITFPKLRSKVYEASTHPALKNLTFLQAQLQSGNSPVSRAIYHFFDLAPTTLPPPQC